MSATTTASIERCETRNLVGDRWITAASGQTLAVTNPATDEHVADVPLSGEAETRSAIQAAGQAFPGWRDKTAADRAKPLQKLAELMARDVDRLALLMTTEQGKPLAESRGELAYAASFLTWAAEEGKRLYGETIPASAPNKRIMVIRQPIGVVAAITPWNFPTAMITRKMGPALACGNTMVVKPAEQTPLSAIALAELGLEAGIPPGVFNVVTGDPVAIGREIFRHQMVRKVSFTGSTEVGKLLMRMASANVVRLSMELGGHAPFLVFDDADIDEAVRGAIACKFRNAGQTCICANRFYVQEKAFDEFAGKLSKAVSALKVGCGTDEGVSIGPLIDDAAMDKVLAHMDDAQSHGAKILTGGQRIKPRNGLADRFYAPTVLGGFKQDMLVSREETFGPVAPLAKFRDEKEVIESANNTPYGLAAYFYTRDASRLMRVAEALDYGIVGANDGRPSTAQAPFGGVKQSGFGREGGHHVMHEYTNVKYISWGL